MNSKHAQFLVLAEMFGVLSNNPRFARQFPKDELHGVDIDKEMELIKQKKSKLSARLRRVVEYRYKNGAN